MSEVVVKRFPDDKVFGAGNPAIARWANNHNARVVSQSVSNGWIIVTFETLDRESIEIKDEIYRGPSSTIIQTRQATDEELRKSIREEMRSETEDSHETRTTIVRIDRSEDARLEQPKQRWWKR